MKIKKLTVTLIIAAAAVAAVLFIVTSLTGNNKNNENSDSKSQVSQTSQTQKNTADASVLYGKWSVNSDTVSKNLRSFYPGEMEFSEDAVVFESDTNTYAEYSITDNMLTIKIDNETVIYYYEIGTDSLQLTFVSVSNGKDTYNAEDFLSSSESNSAVSYTYSSDEVEASQNAEETQTSSDFKEMFF